MTSPSPQVFLSYSRNDLLAANLLRAALLQAGLAVFKDDDAIHLGDEWVAAFRVGLAQRHTATTQRFIDAGDKVALCALIRAHNGGSQSLKKQRKALAARRECRHPSAR